VGLVLPLLGLVAAGKPAPSDGLHVLLGPDTRLPFLADQLPAIKNAVFGLVIVLFLIIEPRGLARIWQRTKDYVRFWPFRY